MLKLYFVTVPTLVQFYQGQNQLAAEGARTQATLDTQVGMQRDTNAANAAIADKRLAAEIQLEQYKQKMTELRESRELSSKEKQAQAKQLSDEMQAALGRKTDLAKTVLTQQGEMERQQKRMEAEAPKLQAETQKAQQEVAFNQARQPQQLAKLDAETQLAKERALAAGSPDIQGILTTVAQMKDKKNDTIKAIGQTGYNNMLQVLKGQAESMGVDLTNNPDYLDATKEARQESVQQVAASLKTFATDMQQKGATDRFTGAKTQLMNWVATGRITPEEARSRLMQLKQKMAGLISSEELNKL